MSTKKQTSITPFSMNLRDSFQEAPPFRPGLNLGCLYDLPTGRYMLGYDGHYYHTGGLNQITGIGGRGNMFKSAIAHTMLLTVLNRYHGYINAQTRDSEFTQTYARFNELATHMDALSSIDLANCDFFLMSSQGENSGNAWFAQLQEYLDKKRTAAKKIQLTSPFLDAKGDSLKMLPPSIFELDSLSQFTTDVATKILQETEVGDSAAQTVHMRGAGAKYQMMMQLPSMMASSGSFFITTAHMDEEIKLDMYAPDTRKLTFMKSGLKFKNVPNNFHTLTNNLWMVLKTAPLQDKEKKPYFPRNEHDRVEGDPDLMTLTLWNLRGKQGPSGLPFELVLSQREGVLVPVTEYLYLKAHGHYGVTESGRELTVDLYPALNFDRKTLRGLVYMDPLMARAISITAELCQLKYMKPEHHSILLSPRELHKKLIELGYDWNKLLDTRGYWVFREMESTSKPFLSTLDLLTMATNTTTQPWYAQFKK